MASRRLQAFRIHGTPLQTCLRSIPRRRYGVYVHKQLLCLQSQVHGSRRAVTTSCFLEATAVGTQNSSEVPKVGNPKKSSPYRLLSYADFKTSFQPLQQKGWRMVSLSRLSNAGERQSNVELSLEGKRLLRAFQFEGEDAWSRAITVIGLIGSIADEQKVKIYSFGLLDEH